MIPSTPSLLALFLAGCLPVAAQNATVMNFWDFEADFDDKAGNAHGTAGAEVTTAAGHDGNTAAYFPGALSGGGGFTADGYVDIDESQTFNPGTSAFAVSYWFKIGDDGTTSPRGILDFSGNGGDGFQSLYIDNSTNPNGTPSLAFRIDGTTVAAADADNVAFLPLTEDDQWHFVVANYTPGVGIELHFDGFGIDSTNAVADYGTVDLSPDQYIGAFNVNGTAPIRGTEGAVDDVAIYRGTLSEAEITGLFDGTLTALDINAPPPPPRPVGHYWDMDTQQAFIPVDLYGNLLTAEFGFVTVETDAIYGEAYPGAGASLNTAGLFGDHLVADTFESGAPTALDFGAASFAFSFWSYNDTSDGDPFGAIVFDCLAGETTGIQLGTTATGTLNLRLDDDAGNSIVTGTLPGYENVQQPADQWVHVAINADRIANRLEIFFDGAPLPEGAIDISSLTGSIFCTQELEIGALNGGLTAGGAQDCGLDDFAIYPGTLSSEQISALAAATVTPLDVLATFEPPAVIPVVSIDYDDDEFTVVFSSNAGATYSLFGGSSLDGHTTWPELSTADLLGDGGDLRFTYAPPGAPASFFFQVRED